MSLAATVVVVSHLILYGAGHEIDEGAIAHIWQLLMCLQIPLVALFAFRLLPRTPGRAFQVLAVQVLAAGTAVLPVWLFDL
jgi:hypothetical protein